MGAIVEYTQGGIPISTDGNRPPVDEKGIGSASLLPWGAFAGDELEHVPELQWPISVRVYHRMRFDTQLKGLHGGSTMPIRRFEWQLDPNGCPDEMVQALSEDTGLPIRGQEMKPQRRRKRRFSFDKHLYHALLALIYGHMYFEQVGEIPDADATPAWRLRKLAPRMPQSITEIQTLPDGGLHYIRQNTGPLAPPLTVDRLLAYIWEQEGPNWVGNSMFRSCYKNWLLKDRILRVGAINIERGGGVPYGKAAPGTSTTGMEQLQRMAQAFKVGETAGGALPPGAEMAFAKAAGGNDAINYIHLQNEEMSRAYLMMFMMLGQTNTGSRALGSSFIEFFWETLMAIAKWVADTFNEFMIEDWVDWNYGEDTELAPLLVYEKREDPQLVLGDLAQLIDKGAITVDEELEDAIRDNLGLPEKAAGTGPPPGPTQPPAPGDEPNARRQQRARAAGDASSPAIPLPPRPLRRQPYDHEIAASTDFAAMDSNFNIARDLLVAQVRAAQGAQIQELHDAIVEAGEDLGEISNVQASAIHSDVIHQALVNLAQTGAQAAREEAERQGEQISMPDLDPVNASLANRAEALDNVLADNLSQAAARKAMAMTGGSLSAAEVANATADHLRSLSDSWLRDQLGGALQQGINAGRRAAMREGPAARIYASEILDVNTCGPCTDIDGTQYVSMDDAERDYPSGGFTECAGGPRCRGTLVAVYGEGVSVYDE